MQDDLKIPKDILLRLECRPVILQWCVCVSYLTLVPGLGFSSAAVGDVLVLRAHLRHDGVHVQVAAVVHLHDDGGVFDLALQLTQLLISKLTWRSTIKKSSTDITVNGVCSRCLFFWTFGFFITLHSTVLCAHF